MQKDYTKIDEEFDKKFKCIQGDCDGHGNIPVLVSGSRQISETECEQCQFHAEYLFPFKNFLHNAISLSEQSLLKALKLLEIARCPDQDCDNKGTVACRISDDEWESQQCQWCDERKNLLTSLKHLPQEEVMIDGGNSEEYIPF